MSKVDQLELRRHIALSVNQAIRDHPSVSAILVFGSVATGQVDERSDVDMLVICKSIPKKVIRQNLLLQLSQRWQFDHPSSNELFPTIDEHGLIENVPVTLHYQRIAWIQTVLDQVVNTGAIKTRQLPFRPYTLAGLLQRSWLLSDRDALVKRWREKLVVYPDVLKENVINYFRPILIEQVEELVSNAERGIGSSVFIFNLNWAIDACIGILYAINGVYDSADRRAQHTIWPHLALAPKQFCKRLNDIMEGPFDKVTAVVKAREFKQLAKEILELTA
jgi:predicted nucleotidyltransferase